MRPCCFAIYFIQPKFNTLDEFIDIISVIRILSSNECLKFGLLVVFKSPYANFKFDKCVFSMKVSGLRQVVHGLCEFFHVFWSELFLQLLVNLEGFIIVHRSIGSAHWTSIANTSCPLSGFFVLTEHVLHAVHAKSVLTPVTREFHRLNHKVEANNTVRVNFKCISSGTRAFCSGPFCDFMFLAHLSGVSGHFVKSFSYLIYIYLWNLTCSWFYFHLCIYLFLFFISFYFVILIY